MGSLFKSSTPAPTPPAPPSTIRDEVNGVEQVPVKNADGSITYITRNLPLTPEQKAQKDQLDGILADSLTEIQRLSAADYAPDEATQAVLERWKTAQSDLMNTQYAERGQREEEALARRGMGDSMAAESVRRQRTLDGQKAEQNIDLMADEMAQQVRNEKLSLQQNLYNMASTQTDVNAARTAQAAARAQSSALAVNAQRQASIMDYYGGNTFGSALGSALGGSIGRGAGTVLGAQTGGVFGTVGNMLGSLFARG